MSLPGDYDFNDLVISYNIKTILNSENKVTQIDYSYIVESIGGSFTNGFGVELEGVLPSAISSVSGANLTEGIINNNANGTESLQPNAVIVFFDNSHINVGLSNTISKGDERFLCKMLKNSNNKKLLINYN